MKNGRIDFSALDPSRDEDGWERRISSVVTAVSNRRQPNESIWVQLAAWAKPPLIAAGVVAAVCLAALIVTVPDTAQSRLGAQQEPALALAGWAAGANLPSTNKILQVLGGAYDEE